MKAAELLEKLRQIDETAQIEAKRAQKIDKSVTETVCAFSNEPGLGGGWLLLGVVRREEGVSSSYVVEGVAHPDKLSSDLACQCAEIFNQPVRVEMNTEMVEGKAVIVVRVSEREPQEKPLFFKATGLPKGAFRRIGSTNQRCTEVDIEQFYQARQTDTYDVTLVSQATVDEIDPEAVAEYRMARSEANPNAEELRWSDEELLQGLNALQKDPSGILRPTVAGLLLFGTTFALRRFFPMTRVDYIRVPGREWVADPDKRFDTIEMRNSLFTLLRRVQNTVLDDLPKSFALGEGALQREDQPAIPPRALREALVNALMHRNYRTPAPVQIIRFANRLEIRNPGYSLKPPENLGDPGSLPRNPAIAAVLHEARYAETKGSGIRAIQEIMEKAGLLLPNFESERGEDRFTAKFYFHHFLERADISWLAQFKELKLSEQEVHALIVARETGLINNATYRSINRVETLVASGALRRLRNAGLLSQHGRGSATWYQPTEKLLSFSPQEPNPSLDLFEQDDPGLSGKSESLSGKLEALPQSLKKTIKVLGQRSSPQQMQDLIAQMCTICDWSAEELGLLLNRKVATVRQLYMRPLLQEGRVEMTMPDAPNSPKQSYRTVSPSHNAKK